MASRFVVLVCNVIVALLATDSVLSQNDPVLPSFVVTPSDTTAADGLSVTLYCSVANLGRHQVFWNVDQGSTSNTVGKEFTLGPNFNSHDTYQRFQFVGDAGKGEFNLEISNVTAIDGGSYICLVNDPNNAASTAMEAGARLTVVDTAVPPTSGFPQCTKESNCDCQGVYEEDDILTLTCSSRGGIPLPQLSWVRVKDNTIQNLQSQTIVRGDVITTTSIVTLSSVDHLSFYRCIETHPTSTQERDCREPFASSGPQTPLIVLFKPDVKLSPDVVNVQTLESTTVELRCEAYANPPLTSGPKIILPENKTFEIVIGANPNKTAVMVEMTTDDVGKTFYCRATNDLGVGEDSVEVRRLKALPTWLTLVIIGSVALIIFIFIAIVGCILCVDRSDLEDKRKDPNRLRYSVQKSRPTSTRNEGEDDFIDGYQDGDMVPIEDFQGGQESIEMQQNHKTPNNDNETGETGPRYQNVNEAFHGDSIHSNSLSQSNPSSSERMIIDPSSE